MKIFERFGHADHKENEDIPFIELSTTDDERAHLLIHTIELDSDVHSTEYTKLCGKNYSGIRISENSIERDVVFNQMADGHVMHDNSNNTICGYDTDAYMLVITRYKNRGTERVLMINGSYLRLNGKAYISSFTKKTQEVITERTDYES